MKKILAIGVTLLLASTTALAVQDQIAGLYSYLYGDNETVAQAKQNTKALAIREAIESYYLFVESSIEVSSNQTREDLIRIISAGYLRNLQVIYVENGRNITASVTALVNREDVERLVTERIPPKPVSAPQRVQAPMAMSSPLAKSAPQKIEAPMVVKDFKTALTGNFPGKPLMVPSPFTSFIKEKKVFITSAALTCAEAIYSQKKYGGVELDALAINLLLDFALFIPSKGPDHALDIAAVSFAKTLVLAYHVFAGSSITSNSTTVHF